MLSDIELFYTEPSNISDNDLQLVADEFHHAVNVMRKRAGEELFVTDGVGNIYATEIKEINKNEILSIVNRKYSYTNPLENFTIWIPRLKNANRLEFALEKSVELGFTKFIIFESERTIGKGEKLNRWNKILLSAMKQSLRSYLPSVRYVKNINSISFDNQSIVFEQHATETFSAYLENIDKNKSTSLIFGPEGGFSENELRNFDGAAFVALGKNRLRSETAIITAASLLSSAITG